MTEAVDDAPCRARALGDVPGTRQLLHDVKDTRVPIHDHRLVLHDVELNLAVAVVDFGKACDRFGLNAEASGERVVVEGITVLRGDEAGGQEHVNSFSLEGIENELVLVAKVTVSGAVGCPEHRPLLREDEEVDGMYPVIRLLKAGGVFKALRSLHRCL